ncbi:MAG: hypothetical protein K940chlam6_01238 [Chlamydiae bacterium]|nr:hypothetical protein [Chlamydiota bacterium]
MHSVIGLGYASKVFPLERTRNSEEGKTGNTAPSFFEGVFELFQSCISFLGTFSSKSPMDQKTDRIAKNALEVDDFEVVNESKEYTDPNLRSALLNLRSGKTLADNTVMQGLDFFGVSYA